MLFDKFPLPFFFLHLMGSNLSCALNTGLVNYFSVWVVSGLIPVYMPYVVGLVATSSNDFKLAAIMQY